MGLKFEWNFYDQYWLNRINPPAASHDKAQWGHRGALASGGVLDRMAGGWRCDLDMIHFD